MSDEDMREQSDEIKDLTPFGSSRAVPDGGEAARLCVTSITPPRATGVLINMFRKRLESVLINSVDYPPGLFFVQ